MDFISNLIKRPKSFILNSDPVEDNQNKSEEILKSDLDPPPQHSEDHKIKQNFKPSGEGLQTENIMDEKSIADVYKELPQFSGSSHQKIQSPESDASDNLESMKSIIPDLLDYQENTQTDPLLQTSLSELTGSKVNIDNEFINLPQDLGETNATAINLSPDLSEIKGATSPVPLDLTEINGFPSNLPWDEKEGSPKTLPFDLIEIKETSTKSSLDLDKVTGPPISTTELSDPAESEVAPTNWPLDMGETETTINHMPSHLPGFKAKEMDEMKNTIGTLSLDLKEMKATATNLMEAISSTLASDLAEMKAIANNLPHNLSEMKAAAHKLLDGSPDVKAAADNLPHSLPEMQATDTNLPGDSPELKVNTNNLPGDLTELKVNSSNLSGHLSEMEAASNNLLGNLSELKSSVNSITGNLPTDLPETTSVSNNILEDLSEIKSPVNDFLHDLAEIKATSRVLPISSSWPMDSSEIKATAENLADIKGSAPNLHSVLPSAKTATDILPNNVPEMKAIVSNLLNDLPQIETIGSLSALDSTEMIPNTNNSHHNLPEMKVTANNLPDNLTVAPDKCTLSLRDMKATCSSLPLDLAEIKVPSMNLPLDLVDLRHSIVLPEGLQDHRSFDFTDNNIASNELNKSLIDQILNDVLTAEEIEGAKRSSREFLGIPNLNFENDSNRCRTSTTSKEIEELLIEINDNLKLGGFADDDFVTKHEDLVKMSPLPSKGSGKLAASPTPMGPSSKPNFDFLKSGGDENSNQQQSPKFVGLPEFDESTIPELPGSINTNLEVKEINFKTIQDLEKEFVKNVSKNQLPASIQVDNLKTSHQMDSKMIPDTTVPTENSPATPVKVSFNLPKRDTFTISHDIEHPYEEFVGSQHSLQEKTLPIKKDFSLAEASPKRPTFYFYEKPRDLSSNEMKRSLEIFDKLDLLSKVQKDFHETMKKDFVKIAEKTMQNDRCLPEVAKEDLRSSLGRRNTFTIFDKNEEEKLEVTDNDISIIDKDTINKTYNLNLPQRTDTFLSTERSASNLGRYTFIICEPNETNNLSAIEESTNSGDDGDPLWLEEPCETPSSKDDDHSKLQQPPIDQINMKESTKVALSQDDEPTTLQKPSKEELKINESNEMALSTDEDHSRLQKPSKGQFKMSLSKIVEETLPSKDSLPKLLLLEKRKTFTIYDVNEQETDSFLNSTKEAIEEHLGATNLDLSAILGSKFDKEAFNETYDLDLSEASDVCPPKSFNRRNTFTICKVLTNDSLVLENDSIIEGNQEVNDVEHLSLEKPTPMQIKSNESMKEQSLSKDDDRLSLEKPNKMEVTLNNSKQMNLSKGPCESFSSEAFPMKGSSTEGSTLSLTKESASSISFVKRSTFTICKKNDEENDSLELEPNQSFEELEPKDVGERSSFSEIKKQTSLSNTIEKSLPPHRSCLTVVKKSFVTLAKTDTLKIFETIESYDDSIIPPNDEDSKAITTINSSLSDISANKKKQLIDQSEGIDPSKFTLTSEIPEFTGPNKDHNKLFRVLPATIRETSVANGNLQLTSNKKVIYGSSGITTNSQIDIFPRSQNFDLENALLLMKKPLDFTNLPFSDSKEREDHRRAVQQENSVKQIQQLANLVSGHQELLQINVPFNKRKTSGVTKNHSLKSKTKNLKTSMHSNKSLKTFPKNLDLNLDEQCCLVKHQLRLTFDDDYPSLPESVNSNSTTPTKEDEINSDTRICPRGENISDGELENATEDDIPKGADNTKPQDMKLSSNTRQISTISSASVPKPDISYDEMAMDIDLECTQTLEDDLKTLDPNQSPTLTSTESKAAIERPKSRLTLFVESAPVATEESLDRKKRETFNIPSIESPIVADQEVKGRRTFAIESDRLDNATPNELNTLSLNVSTDDKNTANNSRPQTPNLVLIENENSSRPETPTLDSRLNATLDMTSSFLSAKSSAANSPSFPVKQSIANNNLFPRSPGSKTPRKMSFLEKSNYDEPNLDNIIPIVDNSEEDDFSKPSLVMEPINKLNNTNADVLNDVNKRRTFNITSPPKQLSNSFPLTSSIDLNDEINSLEKRRTFCINPEEIKETVPSVEDKRRTFVCNDESAINKNDAEVASLRLEGDIPDEIEPMDVDVSIVENQSKLLNQTCEMVDLASPKSPPLPALQKRQAIEIPPAVDIIPLACASPPDLTRNGNLKTCNAMEVPINSKLVNVDTNTSSAKEQMSSVPGALTKGETFTLESKTSNSPPVPTMPKRETYTPPIPLSDTTENISDSADQCSISSSPPIPTLATIKQENEITEKFVSSSPPLPAMARKLNGGEKGENIEGHLGAPPVRLLIKQEDFSNDEEQLPDIVTPTFSTGVIKKEVFSTPESFESFTSSPPPITTKDQLSLENDSKQKFSTPETFTQVKSSSPPIPTIHNKQKLSNSPPPPACAPIPALQKRKSLDDVVEKQQMSPAQIAKIQKRRPLHLHPKPKENISMFKTPAVPVDQNLSAKEKSSKDEKEYFEKHYAQSSLDDVFGSHKFEKVSNGGGSNDLPDFDEDFRNAESNIILNPSDFEYLLTKGNNNAPINRNSILLRFDPLVGSPTFINQPQQQQQQLNQILNINTLIPTVTEEDESHHYHQQHQHKDQHDFPDPSSEATKEVENLGPELEVASNDISKQTSSVIAGKPGGGGGGGFAEVSSSLGSTKSISKKANAIMSADVIKDISIDSDSNKCFDNSNIQSDEKKLNYNMDGLEKKIQNEVSKTEDIEKKLKESELREEALIKRITDKDKTINKMNGVIEAYEKTIGELISEKEQVSQNFEKELLDVKADRDSYYHHLTSLETTFADLHIKYEKSKEMTSQLKANEELLLTEKKQHLENLRLLEQRYDKMKNHAMQQLEIANKKLETLTKEHQMETTKLKALLKKEAVANASLNEQLQQKTRENAELFKICDELINGQQGS